MNDQLQRERRWQNVLGQAFLAASASILLVTTKSSWSICGVDFFVILGILSFIFSVLLMVSALGVVIPTLRGFLSRMENAADWMWFTFAIIDLTAILSGWIDGRPRIEDTSWLYNPYFWSIPIWLILYVAILFIVGLSPICFHIRRDGWKITMRRYSVFLAIAFALLALMGLSTDTYGHNWILAFQSLTIIFLLVRVSLKD